MLFGDTLENLATQLSARIIEGFWTRLHASLGSIGENCFQNTFMRHLLETKITRCRPSRGAIFWDELQSHGIKKNCILFLKLERNVLKRAFFDIIVLNG